MLAREDGIESRVSIAIGARDLRAGGAHGEGELGVELGDLVHGEGPVEGGADGDAGVVRGGAEEALADFVAHVHRGGRRAAKVDLDHAVLVVDVVRGRRGDGGRGRARPRDGIAVAGERNPRGGATGVVARTASREPRNGVHVGGSEGRGARASGRAGRRRASRATREERERSPTRDVILGYSSRRRAPNDGVGAARATEIDPRILRRRLWSHGERRRGACVGQSISLLR